MSAFSGNDHRIWTAGDGSEWVKGNGSGYYRQIHRVNGVYKYTYEDADVIDWQCISKRKEPTMTNAIATEVRNAAQFMSVDELGRLWIAGDGLKNADNGKDAERLFDLGALRYEGAVIHVNEDCISLFNRI